MQVVTDVQVQIAVCELSCGTESVNDAVRIQHHANRIQPLPASGPPVRQRTIFKVEYMTLIAVKYGINA